MRDIKKIIKEMTLEEKAGMCSGKDFWNLKGIERLGIPSIMVTDGPHGIRKQQGESDHLGINESVKAVCFPAACATAASFDEDLLLEMGVALGNECRAEEVAVLLGPAVNIKRSPLCGRNFEYFSEDPFLTGKLAAAQIRGVQNADVGTSMKHFAANNQESKRMTISAEIDEQALREIYLTGFEIAVKEAKPWTLMCSYNRLNGEYCSENKKLLDDILRKEWKFDGFVMSDWGAVDNHVKGIEAGLELQMPGVGNLTDEAVVNAVKKGELSEMILDRAVERILEKVFQYKDSRKERPIFDKEKDHALAVKVSKESAVLIKNENVLPIEENVEVLYIGGFAKKPRYQGGGSSHINPHYVSNALECAKQKGRKVSFLDGFVEKASDTELLRAKEEAKKAELVVIFAGLPDSFESEGYDRAHMRLPECQEIVIETIAQVAKKTVVVLHNGSPIEMPWAKNVSAILEMYLGGEGVGEATDALLYGEDSPCGKLPETFPYQVEDNPSFLNFPGDSEKVHYAEGIYVGYRYYEKKKMKVQWPFGHGLSYTKFDYSNISIASKTVTKGEKIEVCFDVTNSGKQKGKEIVQLYVGDKTGNQNRPVKELKGFAKVELLPKETKRITIELNERSFAWYCEAIKDWYVTSGNYQIMLASSIEDIRLTEEITFVNPEKTPFRVDRNTAIGDLMESPEIIEMLKHFQEEVSPIDSDEAVINGEMMSRMMVDMPLRALCNFGQMTELQMDEIIKNINKN